MSDLDDYDDPIPQTPNPRLWYLYGEDPARFLGRDLRPDREAGTDLTLARIRGLEDLELLDEYLRIEAEVFKRRRVVAALNQRKQYLRERGEPVQVLVDPEPEDDEPDEPTVWQHTKDGCGSTDVERESTIAWFCHECQERTNRVEAVDPEAVPA